MSDTAMPGHIADAVFNRRPLTVSLTAAHERRLRHNIDGFNRDVPDDPLTYEDGDLAVVLLGTSDRGLAAGESDEGVWSDAGGYVHPLPRPRRARLDSRVRFAWRAAATAWRAT